MAMRTQREKLLTRYGLLKHLVDTAMERGCLSARVLNLYESKLRYLKGELNTDSESNDYRVAIWAAGSYIDTLNSQLGEESV